MFFGIGVGREKTWSVASEWWVTVLALKLKKEKKKKTSLKHSVFLQELQASFSTVAIVLTL